MIPLLKPSTFHYTEIFDKVSVESFNVLEHLMQRYPSALLDIFPSSLDEESEALKRLESEYFRLSQERKYLAFLEEVFHRNGDKCFLSMDDFEIAEMDRFMRMNDRLDTIDRYILLEHYKVWDSLKGAQSYRIEDVTLLSVFVKAVLRECLNCTLFFPEQPMLLISNYDLSLPLCFLDGKDRLIYKAMAEKNGLFFR